MQKGIDVEIGPLISILLSWIHRLSYLDLWYVFVTGVFEAGTEHKADDIK